MVPTMTLNRFVLHEQRKKSGATGELSDLLSGVALGAKLIRGLVASAGVSGLRGYHGATNVQGEQVHEIDAEADEVLGEILGSTGHFGLLVSEEREQVTTTAADREGAKYVVAFDPLDGSSNLGSNIPVGTIFSIWRKRDPQKAGSQDDFMQSGRCLVAAGYAVYGAITTFVYSSGEGVHSFVFDPTVGEFILSDEQLRTPLQGAVYSANEGYTHRWDARVRAFLERIKSSSSAKGGSYSARYTGSLVADFDRNLRRGGVFFYPADDKSPQGKLRLLYECIPLAFIAEQAGGASTDGTQSVLDILPATIHQRIPFFVGSKTELSWL